MRKGDGRVQVLALREEIFSHLKRGVSVKRTHEILSEAGKLSVSWRQFYRLVSKLRSEADLRSPSPQLAPRSNRTTPKTQAPSVPGGIPPRKGWDPDETSVDELLNGKKDEE